MTSTVPQHDRTTPPEAQELSDWLRERVAFFLECPAADIAVDVKLVEYGLDSLYALTLCGDIEDTFGIPVSPTLAWDHPTIESIVGLLTARPAQAS
ncbi:acyl carrier protein [Streptomyces sp. NPDC047525]|uniref:acyl carrier protein n=1 Tax=Streptomyces sp. NPDC047525 TaxID=3155264 RepID=UPI0033FE6621